MARTRARDTGFTLIELMIVVLIIGILVSLAVPVFINATASAYERSCQANQREIQTAILTAQSFNEDTSTVGAVDAVLDAGSGWGNVLIPNYIKKPPKCQAAGGGLYNMDPAGDVISDKGANQTTFVNQGVANDHRLPENQ